MFEPLPGQFRFPEAEKQVLEFWEQHDIFRRSLEIRRGAPRFVFYEGPPTANGLPHPGHCLTRTIKDLFPRYQTMCGRLVERKAGWDTHGLPVEIEVCKELGIHTKQEIEAYGLEKFVRRCVDSVFRYVKEWEAMTRRLGFWVNLEDAYVTFHQSYVESVWWSLKTLFDRGLLYQGHKVVWWWAQGGTALSAGEVGEGYRTVRDPSVYVRFPLVTDGSAASACGQHCPHADLPPGAKVSLLVWTTTPWTLISNHFAAVGPDVDYSLVHDEITGEYFYIATALVQAAANQTKHRFTEVATCKGAALVGLRYAPPFDCYAATLRNKTVPLKDGGTVPVAWRVVPADFIDLETGTGIVHIAPAYGEVDFLLLQDERRRCTGFEAIPLLNAVAPDGTFTDEAPVAYRGRWVKDCDADIMRELKQRGLLLHQDTIEHEYPFCPRAEDDPLIQYARKSWFVRTSAFKEEFLKNNACINWLPEHIREGRFGDFLRNNVDWALSRERYWGTPLPIWVCEKCGKMEAIGSLAELRGKPGASDATPQYPRGFWAAKKAEDPSLPDHLCVHRPYVDAWTYDAPCCAGARMRRVPEVIDCWWDAGSMPFAQWGFPHTPGSVETFAERFPCDFISEAIDQTRGWFYGLLAISTLLFGGSVGTGAAADAGAGATGGMGTTATHGRRNADAPRNCATIAREYPHPFKACIVLGHVMGEDGLKMSKSKKNYREPQYVFDHYGADAMRWFFLSAQTPWTSIRFQEANIRDAQREFLVRLYNVFSFFNIYANIDGFRVLAQPGAPETPPVPATGWRPAGQRCELDRWVLSELHRTTRFVRHALDRFENFPAAGRLNEFVDALSNWYVRRSRERFWRATEQAPQPGQEAGPFSPADQDKWDAYNTLYEVLLTLSKLLAPFTPFFAEFMYQNLTSVAEQPVQSDSQAGDRPRWLDPTARRLPGPLSVHLCDYPVADDALIDEKLAAEMALVRDIVSLGRAARTAAKLKVRQPLALAEIILARPEHAQWLAAHVDLIADELNIKRVEFATEADHYVRYQIKPDFKVLGPRFGKLAPQVAAALERLDATTARRDLAASGELALAVEGQMVRLTGQDVQIRLEARPGWSAAEGRAGVVVVQTELTPELREEGLVRELIHQVQGVRKEMNLPYEARITLRLDTDEKLTAIIERFADLIRHECLATDIRCGPLSGGTALQVEGHAVTLSVNRA